jgi:divinyl protochlorophyllide a 8-vinyl-reductase
MAYAEVLERAEIEPPKGVIGPNAILQTEIALREAGGQALAERIFAKAGLSHLLRHRPEDMIDEAAPKALFAVLFDTLPRREGMRIALDAGRRTGAYILANRIPAPVRGLLKLLPARLASPLLLAAIQRHAWTFAGSGECRTYPGRPAKLTITENPLKMPVCAWHVGVFEVLFQNLVHPRTRVVHIPSKSGERSLCTFKMDWRA